MVTLKKIKSTVENLENGHEADPLQYLNDAWEMLLCAASTLDQISVKGRENVDALLGCMVGLEMIMGNKGEDDG